MAGTTMTWETPQDSCNELLKTLRDSNLHFIVSESPYSLQICVRKKFLNNTSKQKKAEPSSLSLAVRTSLENKIKDLTIENASLVDALEEANESINDFRNSRKILQDRIEIAENEIDELCDEKKKSTNNTKDETALYKVKAESLEKSLIAKDKKIYDAKKSLDNAHDTIVKLEAEISRLTMSDVKLEAEGKNLAVVECTENDYVKDYNENLIESPSQKPEYWCKQNNRISSQALVQMSPVRNGSPTRAPPCTPPSPHTPLGFPPSSLIRAEQQSSVLPSSSTLSCYFAKSVPDRVPTPLTEEYIRDLSKLNLAPRMKRQEDT